MGKYDDMIDLPNHRSRNHPHMSMDKRAAQFAPFAALTGYGDMIQETGRITGEKRTISEDRKLEIDRTLMMIDSMKGEHPMILAEYYSPNRYKDGGSYIKVTGNVAALDLIDKQIVMTDGTRIRMEDLFELSIL